MPLEQTAKEIAWMVFGRRPFGGFSFREPEGFRLARQAEQPAGADEEDATVDQPETLPQALPDEAEESWF
jgi:hypothetical protein